MNNYCIIAWMDDLQMGAHLAKLSTLNSYSLEFIDAIDQMPEIVDKTLFIIDLSSISEADLEALSMLRHDHDKDITFVGFCEELNGPLVGYFKELGCDMAFKRYDLMKNLTSIVDKIFNAN